MKNTVHIYIIKSHNDRYANEMFMDVDNNDNIGIK